MPRAGGKNPHFTAIPARLPEPRLAGGPARHGTTPVATKHRSIGVADCDLPLSLESSA